MPLFHHRCVQTRSARRVRGRGWRALQLGLLLLTVVLAGRSPAASLTYLGFSGVGYDMSSDGQVVVGRIGPNGYGGAFRWTAATGMQVLSTHAEATGVSADGSTVCGTIIPSAQTGTGRAFRWTEGSGIVTLRNNVSDDVSYGNDISADGSTVIGSFNEGSGNRPFVWSATTGASPLAFPNAANNSFGDAVKITGDGTKAFGTATFPSASGPPAFGQPTRWTLNPDTYDRIDPTVNMSYPILTGISADGSVVVGATVSHDQYAPWYWTALSGLVYLAPAGARSWVAVSPDGRYVTYQIGGVTSLFDRSTLSVQNLADVFQDEGVPVLGQYNVFSVHAITGDAVSGYNFTGGINEGYLVPDAYVVRGIFAGSAAVPEIDPAGLGSVAALVTGALGLAEKRLRARRRATPIA